MSLRSITIAGVILLVLFFLLAPFIAPDLAILAFFDRPIHK